jgi:hypothetical protein
MVKGNADCELGLQFANYASDIESRTNLFPDRKEKCTGRKKVYKKLDLRSVCVCRHKSMTTPRGDMCEGVGNMSTSLRHYGVTLVVDNVSSVYIQHNSWSDCISSSKGTNCNHIL